MMTRQLNPIIIHVRFKIKQLQISPGLTTFCMCGAKLNY